METVTIERDQDLDTCAVKANEFVKHVARDLQVSPDKGGRIIQSVFHALRNRLSHEESFQLVTLLPLEMKGMYVDGWHYKDLKHDNNATDFPDEVRHEYALINGFHLGNDSKVCEVIKSVFSSMNYFITEEELKGIKQVFHGEA